MKLQEIRNSSTADLQQQVDGYKRELFALRYKAAAGDLENANKTREIRKTIARILTVLNERTREMPQGGNK